MRSFVLISVLATGCANDPVYMECPDTPMDPMCLRSIEAGMDDGMGGIIAEAKTRLRLPINLEKAKDNTARFARAAELGVEVPYVKLGDIEVSVEWTITNLTDQEG